MERLEILNIEVHYLFVQKVIALRKSLDYFNTNDLAAYEISWHGIQYNQPDWSYCSKSIACYMRGTQSLFLIANSHYESLKFELPPVVKQWQRILDTSNEELEVGIKEELIVTDYYEVKPYSICLFKEVVSNVSVVINKKEMRM